MTHKDTEVSSLGFEIPKMGLRDAGCKVLDKKPSTTGSPELDQVDVNGDGVISACELKGSPNLHSMLNLI